MSQTDQKLFLSEGVVVKIVGSSFLSDEGQSSARRIHESIEPLANAVEDTIRLIYQTLRSVCIDEQETCVGRQKLIATVALARLLEVSEAILLLGRGGFSVEADSNFRVFLDAYFVFGNVCNDHSFVPKYFRTDLPARLKIVHSASKMHDDVFSSVKEYATADVIKGLKEEIKETEATELNSYLNAEKIGCSDHYHSLYRITSAAVHSSPRSLVSYVREDESSTVVELLIGPRVGDIPHRIAAAGDLLLNALTGFAELFGLGVGAEIETRRKVQNHAYSVVSPDSDNGLEDVQ